MMRTRHPIEDYAASYLEVYLKRVPELHRHDALVRIACDAISILADEGHRLDGVDVHLANALTIYRSLRRARLLSSAAHTAGNNQRSSKIDVISDACEVAMAKQLFLVGRRLLAEEHHASATIVEALKSAVPAWMTFTVADNDNG